MYFSSHQIPELEGLNYKQRMWVIKAALDQLTPMQKITLNLLKLLIITPLFFLLTVIQGWVILLALLIAGLTYPLITKPATFWFIRNNLVSAKANLPADLE